MKGATFGPNLVDVEDVRLSGPVFEKTSDPDAWVRAVKKAGYEAAELPLPIDSDETTIESYLAAAEKADILIGEVGAWSNPIDPDPIKAREAVAKGKAQLAWAERIGARCCVNITGSRNPVKWDGPHPDNFSRDTFDLIVQTTREIIDAVKPRRTFFTLETMPWIFPSSPDEYLELIKAIDRPGFAVHLDPVNMINSARLIYRTGDFIRECFAKLGPWIKSCHAKDIILREHLTLHLDECRPGTGVLDYPTYLRELARIDPNTILALEHIAPEEYPVAAEYIRSVQRQIS